MTLATTSARSLVRVSARALPRRAVALHVAAAVALLAVTAPGLDDTGTAVLVLRGVAVLLAAALALAVDEPSAALLDATPTPLAERLAARTAVCAAVVAPAWLLALAVATLAGADLPLATVTIELAALAALGMAVPSALRRWSRTAEPAVVTGPLLLGLLVSAAHLPPELVLLAASPADPAWGAAHVRWSLLLLAGLSLLAVAASDPATAGGADRSPRRSRHH